MHIPADIPRNFAFAADTTVQYAAEVNRLRDQAAHLACAALLAGGEEPAAVAARFGVTLEAVQRVCGLAGHTWTRWEAGDGVWYQQGAEYCEICRVDREYDSGEDWSGE